MSVMMKIGMANEQAKALRGISDEDDATDCDLPHEDDATDCDLPHEDNDELELASQGSLIVSLRPRASIALSSSSSDDDEDDADEYDAGVPPTGLHAPVAVRSNLQGGWVASLSLASAAAGPSPRTGVQSLGNPLPTRASHH